MDFSNTSPEQEVDLSFDDNSTPSLDQYLSQLDADDLDDRGRSSLTPDDDIEEDNRQESDGGKAPGDSKRRRIARACDTCRKKKIKCDGQTPCRHCKTSKTECHFTYETKKRTPPKGAKYIEGLENRLARMESLLRLSGILADDDEEGADLATLEQRLASRPANSTQLGTPRSTDDLLAGDPATANMARKLSDEAPASAPNKLSMPLPYPDSKLAQDHSPRSRDEAASLSDLMSSLLTNSSGETRYIGSSSGFSIFSPKGIQWVNQKTGDTSFQDMIYSNSVEESRWVYWPSSFADMFQRKVYQALPSKQEALSLVKDYFHNFNCIFPLFHEPTFLHHLEAEYSGTPRGGSGWWASLNAVFALAQRLRIMSAVAPNHEGDAAWGYMKNCLSVQTQLTMQNTDLLSVQALLAMSLFLSGTPSPQPSYFLIAAAIRLAQSIGLHKRGSGFNLGREESEQRKRVFWIAYMLDRDVSLRSGRPHVQDDDDMDVELPSVDPPDNIGVIPLNDGKGTVNIFRHMCTFGVIQSKVYKQLYSVKAFEKSDGDLLNTIGELDTELEQWKNEIPLEFRPEHPINTSYAPLVLHIVCLHFAYYNNLMTIHRMSVHHGYWTSRLSTFALAGLNIRPLNHRVYSSAALCVTAARASINLIKYIPKDDYACAWLIVYYPVSALVTLFANILQNYQDVKARSDLKLMHTVVEFLSNITNDAQNSSAHRMLRVCSEFERIATMVLDRHDKEGGKRKRWTDGRSRIQVDKTDESRVPAERNIANTRRSPAAALPTFEVTPTAQTSDYGQNFQPDSNLQAPSLMLDGDSSSAQTPSPSPNPNDPLLSQLNDSTLTSPELIDDMGNIMDSDLQDLMGSFQQPFVPQGLWQMPIQGLEWDWPLADMPGQSGDL